MFVGLDSSLSFPTGHWSKGRVGSRSYGSRLAGEPGGWRAGRVGGPGGRRRHLKAALPAAPGRAPPEGGGSARGPPPAPPTPGRGSPTFCAHRPAPLPGGGVLVVPLRPRDPARAIGGRGDSRVFCPTPPAPRLLSPGRHPPPASFSLPPPRLDPPTLSHSGARGTSQIGRMYPQGRHPVSGGLGCGGGGPSARELRPQTSPPDPASVRSALQVLDLGDLRPHQRGIPVPSGSVSQVRGGGAPLLGHREAHLRAHLGAQGEGRGAWDRARRGRGPQT